MDNPFNLTKCKKTSIRRRTLSGVTSWYYTFYEPKNLNKQERRLAIDSFKHPKTSIEKNHSNEMILYSVDQFIKQNNINDFDVILGVPSSSNINKKIIDLLLNFYNFKGKVFYKGFKKTRIRNVKLKWSIISKEKSLKTKEKVPASFDRIKKLHYDKVSKVSLFPTRFRRYVNNILELNIPGLSCLVNKKILVIDDTFGEGLTMCEIFWILEPYTKNVVGFTVMKDMAI
jgi:hypothetical protein